MKTGKPGPKSPLCHRLAWDPKQGPPGLSRAHLPGRGNSPCSIRAGEMMPHRAPGPVSVLRTQYVRAVIIMIF